MCNIPSNQMTAYNFDVTVIQLVKETIQLMLQNDSQFPLVLVSDSKNTTIKLVYFIE